MLHLEKVTRRFGVMNAVDEVSLEITKGAFIGVIGRSGAGKSTLLRMINRLETVSDGRIIWNDTDVTALKGAALRDWRRRCGMVFQQFNLVGRLDVLTNVLVGRINQTAPWRSLLNVWTQDDMLIALSALEHFDIAHLASQNADTLSGGQQQRVALARALVQDPEIILADEPIASLDPRNTKIVMDALLRLNRHFGITVICNLHSVDIAKSYCDRLIGMAAGRVVFDDVPEALTPTTARDLYGLEAHEATGESLPAGQQILDLPGKIVAA
jgi:phosphonate transport system ATP-binding protein